jgi:hypothetical protein
MSDGPFKISDIPPTQSATLAAGTGAQFQTSATVMQILQIANTSVQEAATVELTCSGWSKSPQTKVIDPTRSFSESEVLGGNPLLIVNITNPSNPATVNVTLTTVG